MQYRNAPDRDPPPAAPAGTASLRRAGLPLYAGLPLIGAEAGDQGVVRHVTDGDTFRPESGEPIRIAGIDAPEAHRDQAKCAAELALGEAASARTRALLDHRTAIIERVGKSDNPAVARVSLGDRDIAAAWVEMDAARWWPRYKPKPDRGGGAGQPGKRNRRS